MYMYILIINNKNNSIYITDRKRLFLSGDNRLACYGVTIAHFCIKKIGRKIRPEAVSGRKIRPERIIT